MSEPHSDALVFFGATGDLAYKKIFPSLQAMLKRGHLDVPVIGVAKAGWNLDQLKARARDSLEKHGGLDAAAFEKLSGLLRYVDGDYGDPATFQALRKDARRRRAAGALPRDPAGAVRQGRRAARRLRLHRRRARRRREAVRPRPRVGAEAERDPAPHVRRGPHLPHRPLPRETPGPQHGVLPLRERIPRGVLEPRPHRERPDHDGGGLRDPGPRRVLRPDRHHARRDPEPPFPGAGEPRDGAAGAHRQRIPARREGEGPEVDSADRSETILCAASSAATRRSRGSRRIRRRKRSPRCGSTSTPGAGRACRSTSAPGSRCR